MTTVTALFMIPTAVIFPTLLREANSPPSSVTLRRKQPARAGQRKWMEGNGRSMNQLDLDDEIDEQDEDFDDAWFAGECPVCDSQNLFVLLLNDYSRFRLGQQSTQGRSDVMRHLPRLYLIRGLYKPWTSYYLRRMPRRGASLFAGAPQVRTSTYVFLIFRK